MAEPTNKDFVNVVRGGQSASVPKSQLPQALAEGYHVESPAEKAVFDYVEENKGIKGSLKVAAAQFADEFAGGIPEIVYRNVKDPLEAAKWEALKKDHDYANTIGGVAGFGAGLFGPGIPGLAAKAGSAAGRATSKFTTDVAQGAINKALGKSVESAAGALGAQAGSRAFGKAVAEKAAEAAAASFGLGVEGAVNVLPSAATEAVFGDLDAAGESLAIAGGIGATLGLAGVAAAPLFKKAKEILGGSADRIGKIAADGEVPIGIEGTIKAANVDQIPKTFSEQIKNIPNADTRTFLETAMSTAKPQADDVSNLLQYKYGKSIDSIPIPVLRGDEAFERTYRVIAEKPTFVGAETLKKIDDWKTFVHEGAKDALGPGFSGSRTDAGDLIVGALKKQSDDLAAKFKIGYGQIEELAQNIPVNKGVYDQAVKSVLKSRDFAAIKKSPTQRFFKGLEYDIKTLDDLKRVMSDLGQQERAFTLDPTTKRAIGLVRDELEGAYETYVTNYASTRATTTEAREKIAGLVAERQALNKQYAEAMEMLSDMGAKFGKKRVYGPRDFANALDDLNATQLSEKLFAKSDPRFLQRLKGINPEAFEIVLSRKRQDILDKASTSADATGYIRRELAKLEPETVDILVSNKDKFADFSKFYNSFNIAKPVNPSQSGIVSMTERAISEGADRVKLNLMRQSVSPVATQGLRYTEQALKYVGEQLDRIPQALDVMLQGKTAEKVIGGGLGAAGKVGAENRSEIKRSNHSANEQRLQDLMNNPALLQEQVAQYVSPISQGGAPKSADIANITYVKALQALNQYLPKASAPDNPLAAKETPKLSDQELHQFEKVFKTVTDPLSVIDEIASGTVTKKQMDVLRQVYPAVHGAMIKKVIDHISGDKKMTYQSRLKASAIFGIPLSRSLGSVGDYQKSWKSPEAQTRPKDVNFGSSGSNIYLTDVQRRAR